MLPQSSTDYVTTIIDAEYNYIVQAKGLVPNKTYYYRAYYTQDGDSMYGEVKFFTTMTVPELIVTGPASDVTGIKATLNATLDTTDVVCESIEYGFHYGEGESLNNTVKSTNLSGGKYSYNLDSLKINVGHSYQAYVIIDGKDYKGVVKTFTIHFMSAEVVDLGLSVKWRGWNVGASKPEEYGRYFAWGDVTGKTRSGSSWSGGGFSTYPKYELDANNNLKPEYDAAHVILGGKWRMPTAAECQELIDGCTSQWGTINGVNGKFFTSKKNGNSIFLPAAGCGDGNYHFYAGYYGYYWSSTFSGGNDARDLYFSSDDVRTRNDTRSHGRSVRPVSE